MIRLLLIDVDDGPEGGGALALGRLARAAGIACESLAFEVSASGWSFLESCGPCRLVGIEELAARLAERGEGEIVVPCTDRALRILGGLGQGPIGSNMSSGGDGDDRRGPSGLVVSSAALRLEEAPDRHDAHHDLEAGYLIAASGRLLRVEDADEAWYRLRALERSGDWPGFFVPRSAGRLYCAAAYVEAGVLLAGGALLMDGPRESWRPALGRSVAGRGFERALEDMAAEIGWDGFVEALFVMPRDGRQAEFLAARPRPAPWIDLLGPSLVAALHGRRGGFLEAGLFHADVPVDQALTMMTLARRGEAQPRNAR